MAIEEAAAKLICVKLINKINVWSVIKLCAAKSKGMRC